MAHMKWALQNNCIPCIEKTNANSDFHDIIDALVEGPLAFALLHSVEIFSGPIEEFWRSASVSDDSSQIHAHVCGQDIVITEATIRDSLILEDDAAAVSFSNRHMQCSFRAIGYEGDFASDGSPGTIFKKDFAPRWRYVMEVVARCLSRKTTSFEQLPSLLAPIIHSIVVDQQFNYSRHLLHQLAEYINFSPKLKKFFIFPRFITIILKDILGDNFNPSGQVKHLQDLTMKTFSYMRVRPPAIQNLTLEEARVRYNSLISQPHSSSSSESSRKDDEDSSSSSSDGGDDPSASEPTELLPSIPPSTSSSLRRKIEAPLAPPSKRRRLVLRMSPSPTPPLDVELPEVSVPSRPVDLPSPSRPSSTQPTTTVVASQAPPSIVSEATQPSSFTLVEETQGSAAEDPFFNPFFAIHEPFSTEPGPFTRLLTEESPSKPSSSDVVLRSASQGELTHAPEGTVLDLRSTAPEEEAQLAESEQISALLFGTKTSFSPTDDVEIPLSPSDSGNLSAPVYDSDDAPASSKRGSATVPSGVHMDDVHAEEAQTTAMQDSPSGVKTSEAATDEGVVHTPSDSGNPTPPETVGDETHVSSQPDLSGIASIPLLSNRLDSLEASVGDIRSQLSDMQNTQSQILQTLQSLQANQASTSSAPTITQAQLDSVVNHMARECLDTIRTTFTELAHHTANTFSNFQHMLDEHLVIRSGTHIDAEALLFHFVTNINERFETLAASLSASLPDFLATLAQEFLENLFKRFSERVSSSHPPDEHPSPHSKPPPPPPPPPPSSFLPPTSTSSPSQHAPADTKKGESSPSPPHSPSTHHSHMLSIIELIDLSDDDEAFPDSPSSETSQPPFDLNQPTPLAVQYPSLMLVDAPSSSPPSSEPSQIPLPSPIPPPSIPSDIPSSSSSLPESSFVQREGKAPVIQEEPIPEPSSSPDRDPADVKAQVRYDYLYALKLQYQEDRARQDREREWKSEEEDVKAKLIKKLVGMGLGQKLLEAKSFSEITRLYENLMFQRERRRLNALEEPERRRAERERIREARDKHHEEVRRDAAKEEANLSEYQKKFKERARAYQRGVNYTRKNKVPASSDRRSLRVGARDPGIPGQKKSFLQGFLDSLNQGCSGLTEEELSDRRAGTRIVSWWYDARQKSCFLQRANHEYLQIEGEPGLRFLSFEDLDDLLRVPMINESNDPAGAIMFNTARRIHQSLIQQRENVERDLKRLEEEAKRRENQDQQ